ncbi:MAG: carboxypeptidase-like regulatory domain-containing protein [Acidobacteriota bacterium]
MKKSLILISVLWLSVALMSQVRSGTIWGHISDSQGSPLPGVSVTLKSPYAGPIVVVSDRQGLYRFPSLESGEQYALTAELQGFKK